MITVQLNRLKTDGNAVHGEMLVPIAERTFIYPALENRDFIIPAGTYPLQLTWSPKFKKLLPLIDQVPDREGIRIHKGTKPEHSQGCVLTSDIAIANLQVMFNYYNKFYDNETFEIRISEP